MRTTQKRARHITQRTPEWSFVNGYSEMAIMSSHSQLHPTASEMIPYLSFGSPSWLAPSDNQHHGFV